MNTRTLPFVVAICFLVVHARSGLADSYKQLADISGQYQRNRPMPKPGESPHIAEQGGQVGAEGWLRYPIMVHAPNDQKPTRWLCAVSVTIQGNWVANSGLDVQFEPAINTGDPFWAKNQNNDKTVTSTSITGNGTSTSHTFSNVYSEGKAYTLMGYVRVKAKAGQVLATAYVIRITNIMPGNPNP